jgi:hypothetical protein
MPKPAPTRALPAGLSPMTLAVGLGILAATYYVFVAMHKPSATASLMVTLDESRGSGSRVDSAALASARVLIDAARSTPSAVIPPAAITQLEALGVTSVIAASKSAPFLKVELPPRSGKFAHVTTVPTATGGSQSRAGSRSGVAGGRHRRSLSFLPL